MALVYRARCSACDASATASKPFDRHSQCLYCFLFGTMKSVEPTRRAVEGYAELDVIGCRSSQTSHLHRCWNCGYESHHQYRCSKCGCKGEQEPLCKQLHGVRVCAHCDRTHLWEDWCPKCGDRRPQELLEWHELAEQQRTPKYMQHPGNKDTKHYPNIKPKKDPYMKLKNAILITNETMTTVSVAYGINALRNSDKQYTFKCTKELAAQLKEGDIVLAEGRNAEEFQAVNVVEIHEESEIDMDADFEYKWVFQKVNTDVLESLKNAEDVKLKELKKQQRNHLRSQISAGLETGTLLADSRSTRLD